MKTPEEEFEQVVTEFFQAEAGIEQVLCGLGACAEDVSEAVNNLLYLFDNGQKKPNRKKIKQLNQAVKDLEVAIADWKINESSKE